MPFEGESTPLLGQPAQRTLKKSTAICFGSGTVLNDMTAALWFSYLLYFLSKLNGVSSKGAAVVVLVGQVADGFCTPLAGTLCDSTSTSSGRKPWLAGGGLCVALSFSFVFAPSPLPESLVAGDGAWILVVYYSFWAALFNFGWAASQVSHLSLIPELSNSAADTVTLTSVRFAFTMSSNLAVFGIAWLVLHFVTDKQGLWLALAAIVVGSIFLVACLVGVEAPNRHHEHQVVASRVRWTHWFKRLLFWQVAGIFGAARLIVVLSQVVMPFFLDITLGLSIESIAIIPLVMQVSSLGTSFVMHWLDERCGRKTSHFIGVAIVIGSCAGWWSLTPPYAVLTYPLATLAGVGSAVVQVTSVAMEADVVGAHSCSGAFVYGLYGFVEKISGGLFIYAFEHTNYLSTGEHVRFCMAVVPACAGLFAAFVLAWTTFPDATHHHHHHHSHPKTDCKDALHQHQVQDALPHAAADEETGTAKALSRTSTCSSSDIPIPAANGHKSGSSRGSGSDEEAANYGASNGYLSTDKLDSLYPHLFQRADDNVSPMSPSAVLNIIHRARQTTPSPGPQLDT